MKTRLLTSLFFSISAILIVGLLLGFNQSRSEEIQSSSNKGTSPVNKTKVIGIVLPMDHAALREIVAGFKESLTLLSETPLEFKIHNAQGDMNVQRSILQQFINQKMDMIVPVTTISAQMALKMVKEQPMVSLAARVEKTVGDSSLITGILDEFGPEKSLDLVSQVIPNLKKITLVHSNSEKIFPEIAKLEEHAATKGIKVQKLMIHTLADLYSCSQLIDKNSQMIFMLKDSLVASGIKTLVQQGKKKQIPVITMDEGTVGEGAAFSLGVKERMIGEQGATLAYKVFKGVDIRTLPIEVLEKLFVFYNEAACKEQGIDLEGLKKAAAKHGYELMSVAPKR